MTAPELVTEEAVEAARRAARDVPFAPLTLDRADAQTRAALTAAAPLIAAEAVRRQAERIAELEQDAIEARRALCLPDYATRTSFKSELSALRNARVERDAALALCQRARDLICSGTSSSIIVRENEWLADLSAFEATLRRWSHVTTSRGNFEP